MAHDTTHHSKSQSNSKGRSLRPLGDRILLETIETEERSAGGIIIPDSAKEKPQQGRVVAVGNGKRLDNGQVREIDLKPGDTVLYGRYSGNEVDALGPGFIIVREDEVLGVLTT